MQPEAATSGNSEAGDDGAHDRKAPGARRWPRCEPAFTHFELGDSADDRTASTALTRFASRTRRTGE